MWMEAKAQGLVPPPPTPSSPVEPPRTAIERVSAPEAPQVASVSLKLSQARIKAEGRVWSGKTEENCPGQLKIIEELMGDVVLDAIDTAWAMDLKDKLTTERGISGRDVQPLLCGVLPLPQVVAQVRLPDGGRHPRV
jgi:hypothetical protein